MMGLYYYSKLPSFIYLILLIFFLSNQSLFARQDDLTEMQKQARIYRVQGQDLQNEGNINEAIPYYQKAILLDPGYVAAYNDAGIAFEAKGWTERAKEMYLEAIKIAPDYPNSYTNLALLYEEQKDYSNAALYWAKRALLGEATDPWKEAAMKRVEDIACIQPEIYSYIRSQYRESPQQLSESQSSSIESGLLQPQESLNLSLFSEDAAKDSQKLDSKARALSYLEEARENFSRGQYVTALKYATIAEYIDSSNSEISSFVEQVRKTLLQ